MRVIKAPEPTIVGLHPFLFAAGSIGMGAAEQWQERLATELQDFNGTLLNPRRDDWDSTWVQSIKHPQFYEQVIWEMRGLELADVVPMYFAPETKAPITLLEFGYMARRGKLIVCCPPEFYRRGNVEVVADFHGIPISDSWAPWIARIVREVRRYGR